MQLSSGLYYRSFRTCKTIRKQFRHAGNLRCLQSRKSAGRKRDRKQKQGETDGNRRQEATAGLE